MWLCFLFLPGIFCAYLLLGWGRSLLGNPQGWDYFWWMVGLVYVLECGMFFVKGRHLRMKARGNGSWVVLLVVCLLYCFALPVGMMHELIGMKVAGHPGRSLSTRGLVIV